MEACERGRSWRPWSPLDYPTGKGQTKNGVSVDGQETPREIPRPAGENAGLRNDVFQLESRLPSDDLALQRSNGVHNILLLFGGDVEFVQSLAKVLDGDGPVFFGDAEAGVSRGHIAAGVFARTASSDAEEVNDVLADASLGVGAEADEKAALFRIGGQAGDEIVSDSGQGIVAAEALVERVLRCGLLWRRGWKGEADERGCGHESQGERQPEGTLECLQHELVSPLSF